MLHTCQMLTSHAQVLFPPQSQGEHLQHNTGIKNSSKTLQFGHSSEFKLHGSKAWDGHPTDLEICPRGVVILWEM